MTTDADANNNPNGHTRLVFNMETLAGNGPPWRTKEKCTREKEMRTRTQMIATYKYPRGERGIL